MKISGHLSLRNKTYSQINNDNQYHCYIMVYSRIIIIL
jgi:hypothetical protein